MPLQLVEGLCESLASDIIAKITKSKSNSINTVTEFCSLDHSMLRFMSRYHGIDYQRLVSIRNELLAKFMPKAVNAYNEYKRLSDVTVSYNTGTNGVNKLLDTGIHSGEITEVCGHSSAGKTQFCHSFATTVINDTDKQVLYIDTDLSFSYERILQLIRHRYPDVYKSSQDLHLMTSKIKVCDIFDVYKLLDFFDHISDDLCSNEKSEFKNIGVVIIDSLTTPLSLAIKRLNSLPATETDDKKDNVRKYRSVSLISQIGITLRCFAKNHSMAIVVVNSQASPLKYNWKNYCAASLLIEKDENDSCLRDIQVTQSNRLNKDNKYSTKIMITKNGLRTYEYKKINNNC